MDKVAKAKLIALLTELPDADERNLLVAELVGPDQVRVPAEDATPALHAASVVEQLLAHRANLDDLFEILNDRHAGLGQQIARTADLVLEPMDEDTDGEGRTEMLMPVMAAGGTRQLGGGPAPTTLGPSSVEDEPGADEPGADEPGADEPTDGARLAVDPDEKTDPGVPVAAPARAPAAAPAPAPGPPPPSPSFGAGGSKSGGGSGSIIALVVVLLIAAGGIALLMSSPPPAGDEAAEE